MTKNLYPWVSGVLCSFVGVVILASTPAKAGALARSLAELPQFAEQRPNSKEEAAAAKKNKKLSELLAIEQQSELWKLIEESKYKGAHLPTQAKAGSLQSLHMLNDSSFLEKIFSKTFAPFVHSKFVKYTHQYGTVAQVEFIPMNSADHSGESHSTYSGIFSRRAIGLLRLSQIAIGSMGSVNPSSALHLFVDRSQMISLVGMPSVDGQPNDSNFFLNPFTNIPGPANQEPASLIIDTFVSTVRKLYGFKGEVLDMDGKKLSALSLIEPASIVPSGESVPKESIHAPYEISLEAPYEVIRKYEEVKNSGDFRDLIAHNYKPGSVIFEVYARDRDDAIHVWNQRWVDERNSKNYYETGKMVDPGRKKLIGIVKLTTGFVASEAGDLIRARHAL